MCIWYDIWQGAWPPCCHNAWQISDWLKETIHWAFEKMRNLMISLLADIKTRALIPLSDEWFIVERTDDSAEPAKLKPPCLYVLANNWQINLETVNVWLVKVSPHGHHGFANHQPPIVCSTACSRSHQGNIMALLVLLEAPVIGKWSAMWKCLHDVIMCTILVIWRKNR